MEETIMGMIDKIEELKTEIKKHEYNLLVLDERSISDAEMEVLKTELYFLEKQHKSQTVQTPPAKSKDVSDSNSISIEFYDNYFDDN